MATPRSIGRFWFEMCRFGSRREPLVQRGRGQEITQPWRSGYCLILRIPLGRRGIALGLWTGRAPTESDEDGLMLRFRRLDWSDPR